MAADIDLNRIEGDTVTPITINLKTLADDGTLTALDCTGLTVLMFIRPEGTTTNLSEFDGEDITASTTLATGIIAHVPDAAEAAQLVAGAYLIQIKTDDGAGGVRLLPSLINNGAVKNSLRLVVAGTFV